MIRSLALGTWHWKSQNDRQYFLLPEHLYEVAIFVKA
jgi:hypothetical protein